MTDYKYQICAFADEAGATPAEQIDAMRANGVTLLELRSVNGKNVTALTDDEMRDFRAQLDAANIGVWAIGSPCGKHPLSEPFGPQLDTLRRTIDIARLAGASRIRMFSFYGYDGSAAARDEVMDRLNRYVEAAAGSGVLLCHENEKGIYGDRRPLQRHSAQHPGAGRRVRPGELPAMQPGHPRRVGTAARPH